MEFRVSKTYKESVLRKVLYSNISTYSLTILLLDTLLIFKELVLEALIITPLLIIISIFKVVFSYKKSKKELSSEFSVLKDELIISLKGKTHFKLKIENIKAIKKGKFAYYVVSGRGTTVIPKGLENIEQFIKEFSQYLKIEFPR